MEPKKYDYPPVSPQWDDRPDQVQLSLFLLGVLLNPHLFHLPDDTALTDPLKRAVFLDGLLIELELATAEELPPAVEPDESPAGSPDGANPFAEFIDRLFVPEENG